MGEQTFGERLKAAREKAGFSVSGLARAVRINEATLRAIESGTTKYPSFPVGVRIAGLLDVTESYLLTGRAGRVTETGLRSVAAVLTELEHQDMRITALNRRVNRLEGRADDEPPHTSRE